MEPLIIGICGMAAILSAFVLDELGTKVNRDSKIYNTINIIGSSMLTYYAFVINSLPFLILNIVWFIFAVSRFSSLTGDHPPGL